MTYMATHLHKNPCPGGHEIKYLVDPSFVIITLYLVCLIHDRGREGFQRNTAFSLYD